jgi:signal transduction histidine kinase
MHGLEDAERFAEELAALNGVVERHVREWTSTLEATSRRLEAALGALAGAKAKLELDAAERERMLDERRLAHRLEAVGQLAAGIAHEINTPLQYVSDSVYFLKDAFEELAALAAELRAVAPRTEAETAWERRDADFLVQEGPRALRRTFDGLDRVTSIVKAMKAFAHPSSDEKAPADLNAALADTLTVCRNEYKYVADVVTDFGDLPHVACHVGELNQVFLNLVVNAAHAIGAKVAGTGDRGTIRVSTSTEGAEVVVRVADTGGGIAAEIAPRVFDPFFTTKPVGKGTGQGLTIARSIVARHGGTLDFDSVPGEGTVFTLRLPIGKEEASDRCGTDPLRG